MQTISASAAPSAANPFITPVETAIGVYLCAKADAEQAQARGITSSASRAGGRLKAATEALELLRNRRAEIHRLMERQPAIVAAARAAYERSQAETDMRRRILAGAERSMLTDWPAELEALRLLDEIEINEPQAGGLAGKE